LQNDELNKILINSNLNTRLILIRNISINTNLLEKLSSDEDILVRAHVALNENTSPHTLEKLSSDKNEYVRKTAKNALEKKTRNARINLLSRIIKHSGGNYDLGKGLYSNLDKYDSVKDFRKKDHGPSALMNKDVNNIDYPSDSLNSDPIIGDSGSSYLDSIPISYQENYTQLPDADDKTKSNLNFGEDLVNTLSQDRSHLNNKIDLDKLEQKYIDPDEIGLIDILDENGLFGLPDGVDHEGHDADQTISNQNPYYSTKNEGRQMYEDKWNI